MWAMCGRIALCGAFSFSSVRCFTLSLAAAVAIPWWRTHCTIGGTFTASQVGSVVVCLQLSSGLRMSGDLIRGLVRVSAAVRSAEGQCEQTRR